MSGKRVNYLYVLIGIIIYLFESSSADGPQVGTPTPDIGGGTTDPEGNANTTSRVTGIEISPARDPGNSSHHPTDPSRVDYPAPGIHSAAFDPGRSYPRNLSLEASPAKALITPDDFTFRETAGFVAVAFLVFSMLGYIGFVSWRRYLQNKYGNAQTLITEEVYDVSDLRNFEI